MLGTARWVIAAHVSMARLSAAGLMLFCSCPAQAQTLQSEYSTFVKQLVGNRYINGGMSELDVSITAEGLVKLDSLWWNAYIPPNGVGSEPVYARFAPNEGGSFDATVKFGNNTLYIDIPKWRNQLTLILREDESILEVRTFTKNGVFHPKYFTRFVKRGSLDSTGIKRAKIEYYGDEASPHIHSALGVPLDKLSSMVQGIPVAAAVNQPTHAPANLNVAQAAERPSIGDASTIAASARGERLALVVGNAAYTTALGRLANPVNDANAVAAALRRSGFAVTVVIDSDQRTMKRAISAFGQRLAMAPAGATGLFYYAGHGVQSRGANYLIPVNASIDSEADVDIEAVSADSVLRQMEEAGASTSIVILDACRNLPITRGSRDGFRGLARMNAPNGSFVAYSTAPGSIAADGSGANSPFASALVAEMAKPGQQIEITFKNVRRAVMQATGGKQTPWDSSSLVDSFTFEP